MLRWRVFALRRPLLEALGFSVEHGVVGDWQERV